MDQLVGGFQAAVESFAAGAPQVDDIKVLGLRFFGWAVNDSCSGIVTGMRLRTSPDSVYTSPVEQLTIVDVPGFPPHVRVLKLTQPFLLTNVFEFQSIVRESPKAITVVDLSDVPYMNSAALGARSWDSTFPASDWGTNTLWLDPHRDSRRCST